MANFLRSLLQHSIIIFRLVKFYFSCFVLKILKNLRILNKHNPLTSFDLDIYRNPSEILFNKGYPFEEHKIMTEDFYILTAWRINKRLPNSHKHPVILQHGLIDSSMTWVLNSPTQSLAFIMADLGYDVWLTNNRGNRYSREHKLFIEKMNNNQYWNFSWDEIAKYDLPANVEYIKHVTKSEKVIYIGHSQGTIQMFAQICLNPEFKKNLVAFVGLGPVAFVGNQYSPLVNILQKLRIFEILRFFKENIVLVSQNTKTPLLGEVASIIPHLCYDVIKSLCGETRNNHVDLKKLGVICSHEPGGASDKTIIHWMQIMRSGKFQMYDYGVKTNKIIYGTPIAPEYKIENLKKFDIPIYLFRGEQDYLADGKDLIKLLDCLPKETTKWEQVDDYGHLDYCWATDASEKIYGKILHFLKESD